MTRPTPPESVHPGYHHEPHPADRFRLHTRGMRCRHTGSRGSSRCPQPAVMDILRGHADGANYWAYCGEHGYGRWVEHGQVWEWRLVPDTRAAS